MAKMYFERNYWHLDIDKLDERINYSDAQTACFYDLLSDGKAEVILCGDKMPNCDIILVYRDEGKLMEEYLLVDDDNVNYTFYYKLAEWSHPEIKRMNKKQTNKMKEAMEEMARNKSVPLIFKKEFDL